MAKCYQCETELELLPEDYDGESQELKRFVCPHCGVIYDTFIPESEERQDYHYFNNEVECPISDENHGYEGKCPNCDHYVVAMNNFMRSEVYGDVDENDVDELGLYKDDVIVDIVFCPNCGADITVVPPKPSEQKDYPFYTKENSED